MWTDSEAAQLLRCSVAQVRHLRHTRRLGYYPGRPNLISQYDLEIYVASVKIIRILTAETPDKYLSAPAHPYPRPFKLLTRIEVARLIRCSPATINKWCLTGRIPFLPGRGSTIDEADIDDFILDDAYRSEENQDGEAGAAVLSKDVVDEIRRQARLAARKQQRSIAK